MMPVLPPPVWTDNYRAPWKCVGGPCRGNTVLCGSWAFDFLIRGRDGRIRHVRYVRAVRVNKRARTITHFLRYFGTTIGWNAEFEAASRKAAA